MDYIDKRTNLSFFDKDLAFGSSWIKSNNILKKGIPYYVGVDGDKMILLSKSGDAGGVGTDENYFIESTTFENGESKIEGIYSIKNKKLLNVCNEKLVELYKHMFWMGRAKKFELAFLLSEINDEDLNLLMDEEKYQYYNYLTSGNQVITHDEVVNYILKIIPKLEKYKNLRSGLSVVEYRAIAEELGSMTFGLRPIPQDLEFLQYDKSLPDEYREVYLPESEQKQRILTYRKNKK